MESANQQQCDPHESHRFDYRRVVGRVLPLSTVLR
jgi:hypothetical protein